MEVLTLERTLTELDHVRLSNLLQRRKREGSPLSQTLTIEHLLDAADTVPGRQMPPDIVTMYSRVVLKDLQTGEQSAFTLCYPDVSDASAGFLSVLSPAGQGLLGQRVGTQVKWPTPDGGQRTFEILAVPFQPEASGQHAL